MRYRESHILERIGFDFYCDIAKNIVKARKSKNYTQEDLAKKIGYKASFVSNIETLKTRVKLSDVEKIAEVLGVSVGWLIDEEIDSQAGKCLYLIWIEDAEDFKLYWKSTSKRRAFLEFERDLNKKGFQLASFVNPRVRVFVKLVGVPVTDMELMKHFPRMSTENAESIPEK